MQTQRTGLGFPAKAEHGGVSADGVAAAPMVLSLHSKHMLG